MASSLATKHVSPSPVVEGLGRGALRPDGKCRTPFPNPSPMGKGAWSVTT